MIDQVITFENQQSWEDFGSSIHEEFKLNTMTGSSSASQIPDVGPNEDIKHALTYNTLEQKSDVVVLDIMIDEIALAEGESRVYDDNTLEEVLREVVARYQARAKESDCHITGKYLTADHVVTGALLRIYRNKDFACKGHPELLHGHPIGMFHCDKCGEMQVAGTFHLPKEETENG